MDFSDHASYLILIKLFKSIYNVGGKTLYPLDLIAPIITPPVSETRLALTDHQMVPIRVFEIKPMVMFNFCC